ncbi:N-acetylglutamate synthase [Marinomonas spartinae]|uniref:N-acetylglutamate synthase n=1 Tax=Marinomonas spartinae TaxID=1792290 RepID=A0A1A8TBR9_9GAMM|nr:GNAT family N-acetyltransferase [Marinomonas spartinae]SBS29258.1 N-acetylglutamate synthase [Marinomonas spartinae]
MNIIDLADEPQHIPMLAKWHHDEWGYLNPKGSVEQRIEKMERYLSGGLVPSTFIAKEGQTVLGSAAIIENDMDTHTELTPWLASVFVAPDHRGKGIGSMLIHHILERARLEKYETLYLFTPTKEQFYSRLGWSTNRKEEYRGVSVTIMDIELNG